MQSPFRKTKRGTRYTPSIGSAILGFTSTKMPKGFMGSGMFGAGEMRPMIIGQTRRKKTRRITIDLRRRKR